VPAVAMPSPATHRCSAKGEMLLLPLHGD